MWLWRYYDRKLQKILIYALLLRFCLVCACYSALYLSIYIYERSIDSTFAALSSKYTASIYRFVGIIQNGAPILRTYRLYTNAQSLRTFNSQSIFFALSLTLFLSVCVRAASFIYECAFRSTHCDIKIGILDNPCHISIPFQRWIDTPQKQCTHNHSQCSGNIYFFLSVRALPNTLNYCWNNISWRFFLSPSLPLLLKFSQWNRLKSIELFVVLGRFAKEQL